MICNISLIYSYYKPRYCMVINGTHYIKIPKKDWFRLLEAIRLYDNQKIEEANKIIAEHTRIIRYKKVLRSIPKDVKPYDMTKTRDFVPAYNGTIEEAVEVVRRNKYPNKRTLYPTT